MSYQNAAPTPGVTFDNYLVTKRTNTLAIVSFVASLINLGLFGVMFGHIALSQIRQSQEKGRGFALAGLIIGYAGIAATILFILFVVIVGAVTSSAHNVDPTDTLVVR